MTHGPCSSAVWALSRLLEAVPGHETERRLVLRMAMDACRLEATGRDLLAADLLASDTIWPKEATSRNAIPGLLAGLSWVLAPLDLESVEKAVLGRGEAPGGWLRRGRGAA